MYKGTPIKLSADFLAETFWVRKKWHDIFKVMKRKKPTTNTLPGKAIIQISMRDKEFYRQAKAKRVQ